jgi:hypothetical protein
MALTWKKQTVSLAHRGQRLGLLCGTHTFGVVQSGRAELLSLETLASVGELELQGDIDFRRGSQLVLTDGRVVTAGQEALAIRTFERPSESARVLAVDGDRALLQDDDGLYVVGSGDTVQLPPHDKLWGAHRQADLSGRHVVLGNTDGLKAYRVDEGGSPVTIEVPPGFAADYHTSVAVQGDVMFVYDAKDTTAGEGIDPAPSEGTGTKGAMLVFGFEDGTWKLRHRLKPTVKEDEYGRFFQLGEGLLSIRRKDKKLDVFEVSPQGGIALSKSFAKGHYWNDVALGASVLVVPNGKPSSYDVWRGTPKGKKKSNAKAKAKPVVPDVVRRLPNEGSIDDLLPQLEALAKDCTSRQAFGALLKEAEKAWKTNALELEAALPRLDAALGELDFASRSLQFTDYPDAPGWIGLARSGHFDSEYANPKDSYAEMGRCPLPPHFRRLSVESAKLRGGHVEGMLAGRYLSELEMLMLTGRIGDKGAKAIAAANLPKLQTLDLRHNAIGPAGVKALLTSETLSALHTLGLHYNERDTRSTKLHGAFAGTSPIRLRGLRVDSCGLRDEDVRDIVTRGRDLEHLDLRANKITPEIYAALAELPALTELRIGLAEPPPAGFGDTLQVLDVGYPPTRWTEAALAQLVAGAPNLESLTLHGTIESFKPLAEARKLQHLDVSAVVPDEVSFDPLAEVSTLETLGFSIAGSFAARIPDSLGHLRPPALLHAPTLAPYVPLTMATWAKRKAQLAERG